MLDLSTIQAGPERKKRPVIQEVNGFMEVLKRIARMCRPHAKFALIGFVALLAANATRLILPLISGWMVDDVIKGGQMGKLMPLCGAISVLTVLRAVSNYIRGVSF